EHNSCRLQPSGTTPCPNLLHCLTSIVTSRPATRRSRRATETCAARSRRSSWRTNIWKRNCKNCRRQPTALRQDYPERTATPPDRIDQTRSNAMADVTYYVALPFLQDDTGSPVAGAAEECQSSSGGLRRGRE